MDTLSYWILGFLFYSVIICTFLAIPMAILLISRRFREKLTLKQLFIFTLAVGIISLIAVVDITLIEIFFLGIPWNDPRAFRAWGF